MINLRFRKAEETDLEEMVALLSDDELGQRREHFQIPLPTSYLKAFRAINEDGNQELMVIEDEDQSIIATFQLSFIRYLTYQGGIRTQMEAVRVRKDHRGKGIGKSIFDWAIERAKAQNAHVLQLTTDKKRPEAIRFYENLGFVPSHEGMKLHLKN